MPLKGEISVKGAKNAALKIIPAALLSREKITITNLPEIEDVDKSLEVLTHLGAKIKKNLNQVEIEISEITQNDFNFETARKFRASIMFVGPLLARLGEVKFPHPGGCVIGAGTRPIDLFLEGFIAMGAELNEDGKSYFLKAKKLKGCEYFFTQISVTGTESLMMTACLAEGTTILKNCAIEPEIEALANYLNSQGAKISGINTPTLTIEGVKKLNANEFKIIPDRIETGTFAILSAISHSDILIKDCNPNHIEALLSVFSKQGIKFKKTTDSLKVYPCSNIQPYNIKTHEYPGFPTDLQSPFTLLATQAQGQTLIHETIYDRRLLFSDLLTQMGANITMCDPHRILINGKTTLRGRKLISPDLRAGITLVLAGLIAQGETEIDNIYQIERGYEKIDERLRSLGAKITKSITN